MWDVDILGVPELLTATSSSNKAMEALGGPYCAVTKALTKM